MEEADGADGDTVVEHSPEGSRWVLDQSAQGGGCNGHYFFFLRRQSYPALLHLLPT